MDIWHIIIIIIINIIIIIIIIIIMIWIWKKNCWDRITEWRQRASKVNVDKTKVMTRGEGMSLIVKESSHNIVKLYWEGVKWKIILWQQTIVWATIGNYVCIH